MPLRLNLQYGQETQFFSTFFLQLGQYREGGDFLEGDFLGEDGGFGFFLAMEILNSPMA